MTDLRDKAARALCAKECAAFGDPPCWKIVDDWGPDNCCEEEGPNCFNRADTALAVVEKEAALQKLADMGQAWDAAPSAPTVQEAAPGVKVKPLEWSKPYPPGEHGRHYDHVYAHLPHDTLYIEWKSWKDYGSYDCDLPFSVEDGSCNHVSENTLEDAKEAVGKAWESFVLSALELSAPKVLTTKSGVDMLDGLDLSEVENGDPTIGRPSAPTVQEAAREAANKALFGYMDRSDRYALGVQAGVSRMSAALRDLAYGEG